jgi:hypothetical protein
VVGQRFRPTILAPWANAQLRFKKTLRDRLGAGIEKQGQLAHLVGGLVLFDECHFFNSDVFQIQP